MPPALRSTDQPPLTWRTFPVAGGYVRTAWGRDGGSVLIETFLPDRGGREPGGAMCSRMVILPRSVARAVVLGLAEDIGVAWAE